MMSTSKKNFDLSKFKFSKHNNAKNPENWKFEDFVMLRTVGTGTFGRVRLCKHKLTKKYYAMKILRKVDVIRSKQVDHILNEKNLLLMIDHPFIVNLYKVFKDSQNLYLIMEFVVGGELFSHLRKVGKFPNDVAKFYAAEIVLILEHLHKLNIAYRDLKPENILLSTSGHVKLTDFGFAKVVKKSNKTFTVCGTPEYLAPEIIQSKGHGKAVDWWALGILIYEMIVGYPPFFDETQFKIFEKILHGKIEFPRFMDTASKDLIRKLLSGDKMKRIGNLKNGAEDIKNHKWFSGVDWNDLYNRLIPAPIPIKVQFDGDSSYYENYSEADKVERIKLTEEQQSLFKDF